MKFPWLKFYPGDWLKEPSLTVCSPATRGIWIDLICISTSPAGSGKSPEPSNNWPNLPAVPLLKWPQPSPNSTRKKSRA